MLCDLRGSDLWYHGRLPGSRESLIAPRLRRPCADVLFREAKRVRPTCAKRHYISCRNCSSGASIEGPAIIADRHATLIVEPDWQAQQVGIGGC